MKTNTFVSLTPKKLNFAIVTKVRNTLILSRKGGNIKQIMWFNQLMLQSEIKIKDKEFTEVNIG
jgi:hypothetical protein